MSRINIFDISQGEVDRIREVMSVKGNDYIVFQGVGDKIRFVMDNSEYFKYVEFDKPKCGRFNLRLPKESLNVILAPGIIGVVEKEDVVIVSLFEDTQSVSAGNFSRFIKVDFEKDIGVSSKDIYKMIDVTRLTEPVVLDNIQKVDALYNYSKIGNKGVMFTEDYMYTDGEGFKVFIKIDEGQLNLSLTMDSLREIVKLSKKYGLKEVNLWDVDNYIIGDFDGIMFGCRKSRNGSFTELQGFFELEPVDSTALDVSNIRHLLSGVRINKNGSYDLVIDFNQSIVQIKDNKVGDYISKVNHTPTKDVESLRMNVRVLNSVINLLDGNIMDVRIYEGIVAIIDNKNTTLLIRRE